MAGLAAAALIGCGDDDDDAATPSTTGTPPPSSTGTPPATATSAPSDRGGDLRTAQTDDLVWTTGWPFVSTSGFININEAMVEPLIGLDRSGAVQPLLAESYEFSDDFTRAQFRLKQGLEFSNGAPVTPDDVFFGVKVALDPSAYGATGNSHLKPFALMVTEMNTIDDRTLEFVFDQPRVNISELFAQLNVIHAASYPDVVAGKGAGTTGPYVFKSWTPNVGWELEPNPSWHRADELGEPRLDSITGRVFGDQESAGLAFEAGEIDLISGASPSIGARFRDAGLVHVRPAGGSDYLGVNVENPAFGDPRVREGLLYAVDRERMLEDVAEGFSPLTVQVWPPSSPAYDPAIATNPFYDPDRARSLLAEAGFSQDGPFAMEYASGFRSQDGQAELLQQNLKDVGVETELVAHDFSVWLDKLLNAQFPDMFVSTHGGTDYAPLTMFQRIFAWRVPDNPSHYTPDWYVQFISDLEKVDPSGPEAKALYAHLNEMWFKDPHIIPTGMSGGTSLDIVSAKLNNWPQSDADYTPPRGVKYEALWIS